jgi:hypothetical protein
MSDIMNCQQNAMSSALETRKNRWKHLSNRPLPIFCSDSVVGGTLPCHRYGTGIANGSKTVEQCRGRASPAILRIPPASGTGAGR